MVIWFMAEFIARVWSAGCRSRYQSLSGRVQFVRRPLCVVGKFTPFLPPNKSFTTKGYFQLQVAFMHSVREKESTVFLNNFKQFKFIFLQFLAHVIPMIRRLCNILNKVFDAKVG